MRSDHIMLKPKTHLNTAKFVLIQETRARACGSYSFLFHSFFVNMPATYKFASIR